MKIVCMGDSLTYGYKVPRARIWTAIAQQQTGAEFVNCGVTGDTTGGMLSRFSREVLDARPNLVFIMGGLNDLIMGAQSGVIHANLASMCHQAMAGRIIPILGIPAQVCPETVREDWKRIADFSVVCESLLQLRDWTHLFGDTFGINVVDFFDIFRGIQGGPQDYIQDDGMHPNQAGNALMADYFISSMKKLGFFH